MIALWATLAIALLLLSECLRLVWYAVRARDWAMFTTALMATGLTGVIVWITWLTLHP